MKRIFKFPVHVTDVQVVQMPAGSRPLSVQFQFGQLQLWALVDDQETKKADRVILLVGTGNPIPSVVHYDKLEPFNVTSHLEKNGEVPSPDKPANIKAMKVELSPENFIGTGQESGGALVWHFFDLGEV